MFYRKFAINKCNPIHISLLFAFILLFSAQVFASPENPSQLNWLKMAMELFGGLALFLFGMEQMSDGLKAAAGDRMKDLLSKLTKTRFSAALTGAFVTSVIQSSSVTTVLVVGFVSAGLISMSQSIGIIMGANVGTTITAQIVAFKVEKAALLMIAVGFSMLFLSKNDRIKQYGNMLMGLGLVFFGMGIMSEGMSPLRSYEPFIELMGSMEKPLLGILVAAAFTALVQSSSATTGIVIVMASQGFITLPAGIALAFGANVGTCITAILASIGKSTEAKRASLVHVLFNIAGVLVWILFIPQLANLVTHFSPVTPDLTGTAKLAAEVPRQIANAHTIFNIANTLIFIGFTTQLAKLVERLIPEKIEKEKAIVKAKFLDDELLETPVLALDRVRMELGHLAEITETMLTKIQSAYQNRNHDQLDKVAKLDDKADIIHAAISDYIRMLTMQTLSEDDNKLIMRYMQANEDLERIGDVIETNLVSVGHDAIRDGITENETAQTILKDLYDYVQQSLSDSKKSIVEDDEVAAQNVVHMKNDINQLVTQALKIQAERLQEEGSHNIDITRFENNLIDCMKRIYSLTKRIAKLSVPELVMEEKT
jgi:phosphate:Na+ symporter